MGTTLAVSLLAFAWWQWLGIVVIIGLIVGAKVLKSRQ